MFIFSLKLLPFLLQTRTEVITTQVVERNSQITWTVAVIALIWISWLIFSYFRSQRKLRRKSNFEGRIPKKTIKAKDELSAIWLRKGASKKIHAIGIGKLETGENCIQVFVNNSGEKMFENSPTDNVPNDFRGIPLVLIAMPQASFLSANDNHFAHFSSEDYRKIIREEQRVIMGGISGANTNLDSQCGTIGYFCRRKSLFPRKSEVFMLSNSHVFVDLKKGTVDEHDLIMQPSPGESASSRAIGELVNFSPIALENDTNEANFVDAAIAKLWKQQPHKPLIPMIGAVKGFVKKEDVEVGESSRKFGRTTGFTSGNVFSVYLDIWIKYDRTGQNAFFKNQFLIEPEKETYEKFVEKGDSGSLVVDGENYASGLIFAGANGTLKINESSKDETQNLKEINNYGVANPISDVLNKLKIELSL